MYLDDWLILSDSRQKCSAYTQFPFHLADQLGFIPNQVKSNLLQAQSFSFLEMHFDTVAFSVQPITARLDKLSATLASLQVLRGASARDLASLLGQMENLSAPLPLGRLSNRQFQRGFRDRWSQVFHGWDETIVMGHPPIGQSQLA